MQWRAWLAIVPLTASCALVSGLDGITVVQPGADGSTSDSPVTGIDGGMDAIADADAAGGPDVLVTNDARAGTALQMTSMCGSYQVQSDATSFSDRDFSVAFWFQPFSSGQQVGRYPIVWRGGRAGGESGWMIGIEGKALQLCVADPNGGTCTTPMNWAIPEKHLLHVAAISKVGLNQVQRTLAIYVLDYTNGDKGHSLVASGMGQNNWNLPLGLTIGGAFAGNGCTANVSGVIDDLRLWSKLLTANEIDTNYAMSIACNDFNLISNYRFDEGIGSATEDCAGKLNFDLKGSYAWVPSPFP